MDYKNKLKSLLLMCLKKELTIHVTPKHETISIYGIDKNNEFTFNYDCYFKGSLIDVKHDNTLPLDELIEKVKNYKP